MTAYFQGDPRQKIQRCVLCDEPTERCEDDAIYLDDMEGQSIGPVCESCERRAEKPA